ncbi:pyridoxal phosphate-dependent decarboxylase family protein [Salinisphaera hydrothermalis]|uniref:Ddc n=1 Tax=Salinisphaera hydrothermalis (strain C41B8) TaxID=1304275 RepID=A0A084IMH6_SALHC|nr:pyridoxal-dependent decarboxylase [Salinisphaera hydrothermalis]KEZ77910.1 Ddc [Salinisphaera hydrothermalis C41B8]
MSMQLDGRVKASTAGADPAAALIGRAGLAVFRQQAEQAVAAVAGALEDAHRVFDGVGPADIRGAIDAIDLDREAPAGFTAALTELQSLYFRHAVYFHHPRYVAHLNCPVLSSAAAAEIIAAGINSSLDTWDQSAGATLIEQKLIGWTASRAHLPGTADGIFTSGGTQSNLMALLLAREQYAARVYGAGHVQRYGLPAEAARWRIFVSDISHFSLAKAAALLGLGHEAIVGVPVDEAWRMNPDALAAAIADARARGEIPLAIVATFGTTDFGSVDDVESAGRIAREHGLWLHVDAAYGCGLMVSPTRANRCAALAAADSITVDYHKSFFQPVACSALLVADGATLAHVTHHADYLNPKEAAASGTPDQVNKSLQTTRRFDALKLWVSLRTVGPDAIGRLFDAGIDLARATYRLMLAEPRFELLNDPELGALVFRFRPSLAMAADELDGLNDAIRAELAASGDAMIAATRVGGRRYLKFTLMNAQTTIADMAELLGLIVTTGQRLAQAHRAGCPAASSAGAAIDEPWQVRRHG